MHHNPQKSESRHPTDPRAKKPWLEASTIITARTLALGSQLSALVLVSISDATRPFRPELLLALALVSPVSTLASGGLLYARSGRDSPRHLGPLVRALLFRSTLVLAATTILLALARAAASDSGYAALVSSHQALIILAALAWSRAAEAVIGEATRHRAPVAFGLTISPSSVLFLLSLSLLHVGVVPFSALTYAALIPSALLATYSAIVGWTAQHNESVGFRDAWASQFLSVISAQGELLIIPILFGATAAAYIAVLARILTLVQYPYFTVASASVRTVLGSANQQATLTRTSQLTFAGTCATAFGALVMLPAIMGALDQPFEEATRIGFALAALGVVSNSVTGPSGLLLQALQRRSGLLISVGTGAVAKLSAVVLAFSIGIEAVYMFGLASLAGGVTISATSYHYLVKVSGLNSSALRLNKPNLSHGEVL